MMINSEIANSRAIRHLEDQLAVFCKHFLFYTSFFLFIRIQYKNLTLEHKIGKDVNLISAVKLLG